MIGEVVDFEVVILLVNKINNVMKKYLSILWVFTFIGMFTVPVYAADFTRSSISDSNANPYVTPIYLNNPHLADDFTTYYLRGNIGAASLNDITLKNSTAKIKSGSGLGLQGALGRNFEDYRVEIEGALQNNTSNQIGRINVVSILLNGYCDFNSSAVTPYLTAGIGYAGVSDTNYISSSVPAYQIGAGVFIPISKVIALDARYRYFGTGSCSFIDNSSDFKLSCSSFLIGLTIGMEKNK